MHRCRNCSLQYNRRIKCHMYDYYNNQFEKCFQALIEKKENIDLFTNIINLLTNPNSLDICDNNNCGICEICYINEQEKINAILDFLDILHCKHKIYIAYIVKKMYNYLQLELLINLELCNNIDCNSLIDKFIYVNENI